ncbi:hypothetical protein BLA29_009885, partial [Euroglyphus maynei]
KTSPNGEITVINGKTVTSIHYDHDFQHQQLPPSHSLPLIVAESNTSPSKEQSLPLVNEKPSTVVFFENESKNQFAKMDLNNSSKSTLNTKTTNQNVCFIFLIIK